MSKPKTNAAAYKAVLKKVSKSDLARYLGTTRQNMANWKGQVPERYVLQVSVITGIPCEELLPELVKETKKVVERIVAQRKKSP